MTRARRRTAALVAAAASAAAACSDCTARLILVEGRLFLFQGLATGDAGLVAREIDRTTVLPLGEPIRPTTDGIWTVIRSADDGGMGAVVAYRYSDPADGPAEIVALAFRAPAGGPLAEAWRTSVATVPEPACLDAPDIAVADDEVFVAWSEAGAAHAVALSKGVAVDEWCFDGSSGARLAAGIQARGQESGRRSRAP